MKNIWYPYKKIKKASPYGGAFVTVHFVLGNVSFSEFGCL